MASASTAPSCMWTSGTTSRTGAADRERVLFAEAGLHPTSIWDVIKPDTYEPQEGWTELMTEQDPSAIEPDDDETPEAQEQLPPKPDPPEVDEVTEEEIDSGDLEREGEDDIEFLDEEDADDDDTVDNTEQEDPGEPPDPLDPPEE